MRTSAMHTHTTRILTALCVAAALAACGKKDDAASPATSAAPASRAPSTKQTEKFGTVSSIVLEPSAQVPARYASYVRQEVTEAGNAELQKMPDTLFDSYVATWIKQAASVDAPDWTMLAGITHPESVEETNAFKKQEVADKTKAELAPDKNSLNVVFGWKGEVLVINGPDVQTGEYYVTLRPNASYNTVTYSNGKTRYNLSYNPLFTAMDSHCSGRGNSCRDIDLTVKVPIEKAKAIEALRETDPDKGRHPGVVRVYGQVRAVEPYRSIDKNSATATLEVVVEALEIGSRQNGQFQSYFFLDKDQLQRWYH